MLYYIHVTDRILYCKVFIIVMYTARIVLFGQPMMRHEGKSYDRFFSSVTNHYHRDTC